MNRIIYYLRRWIVFLCVCSMSLVMLWTIPSAGADLNHKGDNLTTLLKELEDPDEDIREEAVSSLGRIMDPRVVKPLMLVLLTDPVEDIREGAADVLGLIGDQTAIPALIRALRDEDEFVRDSAVRALGRIGSNQSIPALEQALQDNDEGVRESAAHVLKELNGLMSLPQDNPVSGRSRSSCGP